MVLVVEMDGDNGLLLLELNPPNPWDAAPRAPEELAFGEVQVRTHENHSLLKIQKPNMCTYVCTYVCTCYI